MELSTVDAWIPAPSRPDMAARGQQLSVPADRASVATARHWALDRARSLELPACVVLVVELLTSELVANAVLHGSGPRVVLGLTVHRGSCTVEVRDGSDELPVLRTSGPEVPGGHGMRLVQRLADTWGSARLAGGGKKVWFSVLVDGVAACSRG